MGRTSKNVFASRFGGYCVCVPEQVFDCLEPGLRPGRWPKLILCLKKKAAVHWSSLEAFSETNLLFEAQNTLFVTDGRITSGAGELASLDMVIDFIATEFGRETANRICDYLLVSFPRSRNTIQPGSPGNRLRHYPPVVRSIVHMMSATLEDPHSMKDIAEAHGVSQRQMERLFKKHVDCAPRKYLRQLQLELAHQLCEHTEMPIIEVALASGFTNQSALSKHFKMEFGRSPRSFRRGLCQV